MPNYSVSITSPAAGGNGVIMPPNMLQRCEVVTNDPTVFATFVRGRCYRPGEQIPADPPSTGLTEFTRNVQQPTKWTASNIPAGCVGDATKQCTVKVWAFFPNYALPVAASVAFIGTSGGPGTMTCT